jgi:hypothetical protein
VVGHCHINLGIKLSDKKKTIKYTTALDGWWLPMDQDNQQSTDSWQKWLGGC